MSTVRNLEDLEIWTLSQELIKVIYEYSNSLPNEEKYVSTLHIRKTVRSIADNIAEAHGRYYFKDKIRFWYNSRGSIEELRSQILTNKNLDLGNQEMILEILQRITTLSIKLNNTIKANQK